MTYQPNQYAIDREGNKVGPLLPADEACSFYTMTCDGYYYSNNGRCFPDAECADDLVGVVK